MYTGIVHRDTDGVLWFNDHRVRDASDLPRQRAFGSTLWYSTAAVTPTDWARLMGEGDEAFGPSPGEILGVKIRCGKNRRFQVFSASAWGVRDRDPNVVDRHLLDMMVQTASAGIRVKNSIAGTAMQLYMDRFNGTKDHPRLRQLPCRWRGLAHAALHGGPIAVLRGGAPYASQIDVSRAYLAALHEPVPVLGTDENGSKVGGWYTHDDCRWDAIRHLVGFVDADVTVHGDLHDPAGLPPLPMHTPTGTLHATGKIRGAWTIAQVREAEERGEVEVERVHQFCYAPQTRPLFAEIAELFDLFPKHLAKRLYTRFWGKFGSRGGYVGRKSDEPRFGEVPAGGLWWNYDGIPLDSHRAQPTYRPDLAAFIAASNHRRVIASTRELAPGSIVACHVDAIWTTDIVGATNLVGTSDPLGGWRQKRAGELRFYGTGCYRHDGHLAASGYDTRTHGPLTRERLEGWISSGTTMQRRLLLQSRNWSDDPAHSAHATSTPLHIEMDRTTSPAEGETIYDNCWTLGGWRKKDEPGGEPLSSEVPMGVEATALSA